jgi:hypothetical protein
MVFCSMASTDFIALGGDEGSPSEERKLTGGELPHLAAGVRDRT